MNEASSMFMHVEQAKHDDGAGDVMTVETLVYRDDNDADQQADLTHVLDSPTLQGGEGREGRDIPVR